MCIRDRPRAGPVAVTTFSDTDRFAPDIGNVTWRDAIGVLAGQRTLLPDMAEEVFARSRAWLVDVFICGLLAQAEGSSPSNLPLRHPLPRHRVFDHLPGAAGHAADRRGVLAVLTSNVGQS